MEDGADDRLNDLLIDFAHAADLDEISLRDVTGRTAAASNTRGSRIYASQIYNSCPNFKSAMNGMRHYGIGATKGLPGCFIADPSREVQGRSVGVVAIKINLLVFEASQRCRRRTAAHQSQNRYRSPESLTETARALICDAR